MNEFQKNGYQIVKNIISNETAKLLETEFSLIHNYDTTLNPNKQYGDPQVEKSYSYYGALCFEALLENLLPKIEKIVGIRLFPTYSYARIYYPGAEMPPHIDRLSSEYSATICISEDNKTPWPIWFDINENEIPIFLNVGDMCVFRGNKYTHWREKYDGSRQIQCFLFYVEQEGEYSHLKYDSRPNLGFPLSSRKEKNNNFEYI